MRFAFTPDQLLFRDSLRDVLKKECTPGVVRAAWSNDDGRAPGLWKKLAELGVVGLTVPEANGGLALGELDLVLLLEECGRAALPEPIVETTAVGVPLAREIGLDPSLLAKVAGGDAVIAVGLDQVTYVQHARSADLLLLQHGDAVHAVSRADVHLVAEPSIDRSRRLFRVEWEPSAASRVASGPEGRRAIEAAFDRGVLAQSAVLLGLARQMLDMTVEYVKVRKQFGSPVGSFQAVKHHLSNALLAIEMARPTVYRAAYSTVHGDPDRACHVSMAKACASDAALTAARASLQCHGAIGYTYEHDLHLWMKRAWALAASWGDAAWHRARVGAWLLRANGGHREARTKTGEL